MENFEARLERLRPILRMHYRQMRLDPRLQRRFDSSDIIQNTMLKAHEKRAQFRGTTEPELLGWVHQILKHETLEAIDRETSQKRDIDRERSMYQAVAESSARIERQIADRGPSPSQLIERHEQMVRLASAVEELPEEQREVFLLREFMEYPIATIAERLGKTEKAVAGLLRRGRERLRELLNEQIGE